MTKDIKKPEPKSEPAPEPKPEPKPEPEAKKAGWFSKDSEKHSLPPLLEDTLHRSKCPSIEEAAALYSQVKAFNEQFSVSPGSKRHVQYASFCVKMSMRFQSLEPWGPTDLLSLRNEFDALSA